ncbi:2-oxoglutarate dehydrogenase E1 component [Paenibacillus alkalitolerans]|uniref:2-oxoglutarate dehydrogenase E1 component n=1 Tax=Paenibacillus alkalitolerans TaxID=2799335 RepID=UPI0018F4FA42|nr:2-oxoglutarate dehydrogenase E1 component [Paenibacillus alkalitolerans]
MAQGYTGRNTPWEGFYGPNLGYVHQLYDQYLNDPDSVDQETKNLFHRWGPPPFYNRRADNNTAAYGPDTDGKIEDMASMKKVVAAEKLAQSIRTYGHLAARVNPFTEENELDDRLLDPAAYGLKENDLQAIPADIIWPEAPNHIRNGLDVIRHLREIYTRSIAFQFTHVNDVEERRWLNRMVEFGGMNRSISAEERIALLGRLTQVERFETFLHRTFTGQKRFSIEGLDMMVPILDQIIRQGVSDGADHVMIGMAHRGRLNVLAHVLGKPYEIILSEFHHSPNKELVPSEGSIGINYGWTGDVKYHLGANREIEGEGGGVRARINLANNPSHLEFVNPVVLGFTRAAQEDRNVSGPPIQDVSKAFAIMIHGDAAFPGEGIVAESLNLSGLRGYRTGGSLHVIANNQIGFTTGSSDARTTKYASDLAKGFEIPVVHVNADDPEACLQAAYLAYEYRKRFKKDFLIDLIGYRRFGHNEMDDPAVTQPIMYSKVAKHPSVRARYAETLKSEGVVTGEQTEEMEKTYEDQLKNAYEKLKGISQQSVEDNSVHETSVHALPPIKTAIPLEILHKINTDLLKWPKGFNVYPKLERILKRRTEAFQEGGKVDWALAETLAFATLLRDGTPIRITGQDTERGTFAHRNLILHDAQTGEPFAPLQHLPDARASFAIYNSPLSEASVLGFEYGYDVFARDSLVLWEAQYGDFANAAQVIIDAFIAAGQAKWGQKSNLILLLPHGYEGQGPEHSNARPERFLQLAAENNWTIANLSSAAQYFHIIRRQAALAGKVGARPLIIMTPKGLLRNPRAASPGYDFTNAAFCPVIESSFTPVRGGRSEADQGETGRIERLILCTGKMAIDLETELESEEFRTDRLYITRVEQLYPFPEQELTKIIGRFRNLKEIVWVQEEPRNMGFWNYMESRIKAVAPDGMPVRYIGRTERSSPAEGLSNVHKKEQRRILKEALVVTINRRR